MLQEKTGEVAGRIWSVLNENGEMTQAKIKKAAKISTDKDFYLGLGWLLREDKVATKEVGTTKKELAVVLK